MCLCFSSFFPILKTQMCIKLQYPRYFFLSGCQFPKQRFSFLLAGVTGGGAFCCQKLCPFSTSILPSSLKSCPKGYMLQPRFPDWAQKTKALTKIHKKRSKYHKIYLKKTKTKNKWFLHQASPQTFQLGCKSWAFCQMFRNPGINTITLCYGWLPNIYASWKFWRAERIPAGQKLDGLLQ